MSIRSHHEPDCTLHDTESPIALVAAGREKDLGHLTVRRLLPNVRRRMVGPFVFFDHIGPAVFGEGVGMDVRPHPHVHLATVTYLFEGAQMHRDSLGSEVRLEPRTLAWMSAGSGIVHSERSPDDLRPVPSPIHGIQAWVALPDEAEDSEPTFAAHAAEALPVVERDGLHLRVIAGEAFGARSPVKTRSPLFYVEAQAGDAGGAAVLDAALSERAVYLLRGEASLDGHPLDVHAMSVVADGRAPTLRLGPGAHAMLLGGAPVGERFIEWNFVGSTKARIERAKQRWRELDFALIPTDRDEHIPLPE